MAGWLVGWSSPAQIGVHIRREREEVGINAISPFKAGITRGGGGGGGGGKPALLFSQCGRRRRWRRKTREEEKEEEEKSARK